jgi:hypothetical protein
MEKIGTQSLPSTEPAQARQAESFLSGNKHIPNPAGFFVQPKLSVGSVDDPLEFEADAMADRVMRMPEPSRSFMGISEGIQRKCSHCEEEEKVQRKPIASFIQMKSQNVGNEVADNLSGQIQSARSGGSPLSANTQSFMESRFGNDFTNVRIHADSNAAQLSRALNAQAFTVGNDVFFNQGKFSPESDSGKHLLAHELTHTIQQNGSVEVQRRVSPNIERIKSHLSYGFFDWAITNGDVRAVLNDLKDLPDADLADTLVSMGRSSISKLLENLAESEDRNQHWVGVLVGRIQTLGNITPDIANLESHLSYGFFDWEITNTDVSAVLIQLRNLSDADLQSVVASLESGGLISRLFANLAESEDRNQTWVLDLVQRIQDFRVHALSAGGTMTGSCNETQKTRTEGRLAETVRWATECVEALTDFLLRITNVDRIAETLDRYFFHQDINGALTEYQQNAYVGTMIERLNRLRDGAAGTTIHCASSLDSTCTGNVAAYVTGGSSPIMRVCQSYFDKSENKQTGIIFHELMHFYNRGGDYVGDTGYSHERVYRYLPPGESVDNADSYTVFATDLVLGRAVAEGTELRTVSDTFEDCTPAQVQELNLNIAYAGRMIQNASNTISDSDYAVQNPAGLARLHFKANNHADLTRNADQFNAVKRSIPRRIQFKCNVNSTHTEGGLPFRNVDDSLVLTRNYFNLPSENSRTDTLLAILFKKYTQGMQAAVWPADPSYATQSGNQAYHNPASYAGYSRSVSSNSSTWDFSDAPTRYGEQAERYLEGVKLAFKNEYSDRAFYSRLLFAVWVPLHTELTTRLTAHPFQNRAELDAYLAGIQLRVGRIKAFIDLIYNPYRNFCMDMTIAALLNVPDISFFDGLLERPFKQECRYLSEELFTALSPIVAGINRGENPDATAWNAYEPVIEARMTSSQALIGLLRTYVPYLNELQRIKVTYRQENEALQSQALNLPFDPMVEIFNELRDKSLEFNEEIDSLVDDIRSNLITGDRFRRSDFPSAASVLRSHRAILRRIDARIRSIR